jgi:isoleucyl-tRNA synthetase
MPDDPRDYKATTRLPVTAFPMRANLAQREPEQLQRWEQEALYERLLAANAKRPPFVFHDGPPYANGHLHEGHFLNRVLKDIVVKASLMGGRFTDYIPGWDCHGLPIELAVEREMGKELSARGTKLREMEKLAIRRACRAHAEKFIDIQREEMKRLGILARWEAPYSTMAFSYEAQTVRELARVVRAGAVYRGKKPVFWCWNDRTALAEAEIEYQDDPGPSVYVGFEADASTADRLAQLIPALAAPESRPARFAIWTTTPWTLPANLAIAANPSLVYLAYELPSKLGGVPTFVARDLLFSFLAEVAPDEIAEGRREVAGATFDAAMLRHPERILGYADGSDLEGLAYRHPFLDRVSHLVLGDHVTLEAGTGLVHTAPGHGQEDYEVGLKYKLDILVPVDDGGVLTAAAGPFAGQFIEKANPQIEALLNEKGALLNPPGQKVTHSYPHCWRCKKPVIVRATDQWFISMERTKLRERALAETDQIKWIPDWGRDRIRGMLESRPDWCISRQRAWGVPIPALRCEGCSQWKLDPVVLDHLADIFEREGSDAWFEHPVEQLIPAGYACGHCGGKSFTREQDVLDVWFDSGVSQAAVAKKRLSWPVDLVLEGSDQHRGWFQASLLCALAAGEEQSPFRACLTHGFVVDGQGKKLSKSAGNAVDPQKLIRQYGAEIVRLWAGSENYRDDIRLSDEILQRLTDAYRKLRNTLRFALGVLDDFEPQRDALLPGQLAPLDRYLRSRAHRFLKRVREAYAAYDFHVVSRAAVDLVSVELSALHFDVSKDRLYCAAPDGRDRRSAQTAIHEVADLLCRTLAPILSFTTEEAYGFLPGHQASVFLAGMPAVDERAIDPVLEEAFERLLQIREDVQARLELLRRDKVIGSSQEARVEIWGTPPGTETGGNLIDLGELCIVSEVDFMAGSPPAEAGVGERSGLAMRVSTARGTRCDRCWNYRPSGDQRNGGFVCDRCVAVLKELEKAEPGSKETHAP